MNKIFVSSVAFNPSVSLAEIIKYSNEYKLNFELSANLPFTKNVDDILKEFSNQFLIHNYFPRPEKDFVINLASYNDEIRNKSIEFATRNIQRCKKFNIPIYTIHSGFRFDPDANLLGKKFSSNNLVNYEQALEIFIDSLYTILKKTSTCNVKLLLENNVITLENLKTFGENPLLCCNSRDYMRLFEKLDDDRLGILVDYGHLKVSAKTLGYSIELFYKGLKDKIYAHHLSNNNSYKDTNEVFQDYTELNEIKDILRLSNHFVLEMVNLDVKLVFQQISLLEEYLAK